ncbi:MAG TPA: PRC-barrel domain-containing protein [Hyphomicrobiaceae bacterium]|nr:PRC-barrel domain-containing protein [Hyphomicrobiaceae bacterium]
MMRLAAAVIATVTVCGPRSASALEGGGRPTLILAAGQTAPTQTPAALSPEERMQRRYPQPVKVGDVIGLPVLDFDDRTLGYVKSVVRTPAGTIQLVVPYGGLLGWGRRLVAVPIEVVAIAGRQLAALDMTRAEFDAAPAWNDPQSQSLAAIDIIRIGLYRR